MHVQRLISCALSPYTIFRSFEMRYVALTFENSETDTQSTGPNAQADRNPSNTAVRTPSITRYTPLYPTVI
jgi:hypothetical protein